MLPNFLCIGAAKSGTTTLYEILKQHPDIYCPKFKEPHFFDLPENYSKGINWYKQTYFSSADRKIVADLTPSYFYMEEVPKRIFQDLGKDVKFVVILRNPVSRAYSHYLHSIRDHNEDLSFEDALREEEKRLKNHKAVKNHILNLSHSYRGQGLYGEMLQRYLQYFSLSNFFFIDFEKDFIENRQETICNLFQFLEIDSQIELNLDIKSNPASKDRSVFLKRIMMKKSWWRNILKKIVPSTQLRQIIRNKIIRLNLKEIKPPSLGQKKQDELFSKYFSQDHQLLKSLKNKPE